MKPSNDIPIAAPIIPDSIIGVFFTRFSPNFSKNPSVILNTPPYSAISCPIIRVDLSKFIFSYNASEIASTNLISLDLRALGYFTGTLSSYTSPSSFSIFVFSKFLLSAYSISSSNDFLISFVILTINDLVNIFLSNKYFSNN